MKTDVTKWMELYNKMELLIQAVKSKEITEEYLDKSLKELDVIRLELQTIHLKNKE